MFRQWYVAYVYVSWDVGMYGYGAAWGWGGGDAYGEMVEEMRMARWGGGDAYGEMEYGRWKKIGDGNMTWEMGNMCNGRYVARWEKCGETSLGVEIETGRERRGRKRKAIGSRALEGGICAGDMYESDE